MEPKMITITMSADVLHLILEGLDELPHKRVEGLIKEIRETLAKPQNTPPDLPAIVPDAKEGVA